MLQIGMIVKILPDAEYSGKFTGYIGKVKNYFSQNKKVGRGTFFSRRMTQVPRACFGSLNPRWLRRVVCLMP